MESASSRVHAYSWVGVAEQPAMPLAGTWRVTAELTVEGASSRSTPALRL